jgi:uncharacterized protein (TIGR01777 family)
MKVLIAGGSGFLGSALSAALRSKGHQVWILTRQHSNNPYELNWDGESPNGWVERVDDFEAIVNLTGFGLEHWPWTNVQKRHFRDSRILPGLALVSAIKQSVHPPRSFLQISGINYYGAFGDMPADEETQPGDDYLAKLAVEWEASTNEVEELGIRRIVARSAVVLDSHGGLFPLMVLPVRLFIGGPLGSGDQAVPWIHLTDQIDALCYLLENEKISGVFNLVSPTPTSNKEFMRAIATAIHRPCWFPTPEILLRAVLGEMSTLVVDGRYCIPKRLLDAGYKFHFPTIKNALQNLFIDG